VQAGSLVSGDVQQLKSRITVGGVERAHKSWEVSRDLVGDLPAQVVAGSGIKQATGTIVWAEGDDVTDGAVNPWNASSGWLPKQGEIVAIYVSDGVTEWLQFVGVIDENSGEVGGLPSSAIVDYIDFLNRPVSHSTVFAIHPPKSDGGAFMGVGMSHGYPVDRALRSCGMYATPGMEPGCVLSVPGQMSLWPEYGTVTAAVAYTGLPRRGATDKRASWGWALADFDATYTPGYTFPASTSPVQLTARIDQAHAGTFWMSAYYGSTKVQLSVTSSRTAVARLNGADVVSLAMESSATIVSLLVKGGVWTLKTSGGATASASSAVPAGSNLTSITATADANARVAGMQVSTPPVGQEFQSLGHKDNYYQDAGAFVGAMDALPSYVNRPAIDLLTEISKASLSAMWFDENGKLRFIGSDLLRAQAPAQTVTTLDDIYALSWSDNRLGVRSKVRVKYRMPASNLSQYSNVLLWQGSGETMESNQEKVLLAEAPADEDWAEIDHGAVAAAGGLAAFNAGRGTWVGGYLEASNGSWTADSGYGTWDGIATIDERTRRFRVTTSTLPAGKSYVLATPDDAVNFFPRFRGFEYPALRGRAKVKWTDASVVSATTGPSGFPELEHDSGPWGARSADTVVQTSLADYIASQVTTPSPTIDSLRVGYDPRRQLGDVITISSPDLMGVTINALIVGVRNSAGDSHTQTLNVRIISASSAYATYGQFEAAHPDTLTYEQWRALFPATETYADFNNEPLRGATL